MIKISKKECPVELTRLLIDKLTEEFQNTGKAVWKQPFIETALLESSHNKCCYCESKIDRESKYMEVEHYYDKKNNPSLVVEWENLLPSCKRCNGHKGTYNTVLHPFINPATTNPKDHLVMADYRFYPTSLEGKNTIKELFLNDSTRLVMKRVEIMEAIFQQLEDLLERAEEFHDGTRRTSQNKKRMILMVENLMNEGLPTAEYSGTVSTYLLNSLNFIRVVEILKYEFLWSTELEEIITELKKYRFNTDIELAKIFFGNDK